MKKYQIIFLTSLFLTGQLKAQDWNLVYMDKVFTNADSANLVYRNILEKRKAIVQQYENEYKKITSGLVKSTFEKTSEFENRKSNAVYKKKLEFGKLLDPLNEQLQLFSNAAFIAKGNRFKASLLERDYNADLSVWKIKIVDNLTNKSSFVSLRIDPNSAQKLWQNKGGLEVKQVVDFANTAALMLSINYPGNTNNNLVYGLGVNNTGNKYYARSNGGSSYPKPPPPKVNIQKFSPPIIVKDVHLRKDDEVPPPIIAVGPVPLDEFPPPIVEPPVEVSTGVPTEDSEDNYNKIFTSVQTPSTFPGGQGEWVKFLSRNLNRDLPVENKAPEGIYKVVVSFVVARDGSISDVKADNDPGYGTAAEAVRVIQKGPNWTPAEQNGRKVKYRHRQVIGFQITSD